MSFVFYDTETTGTHTAFDQILQFSAIRTDSNLNEIDQFEVRSRLLPHIVPSPGAMQVTRVRATQLIDRAFPSHYEMVRLVQDKFLSWSPAVFIGYNSIDFDEHLFRQALYKTLHPPYLTNTNGNARSDVMRMVQAAYLFSPKALKIPIGDRRKPTFKLDRVAPANGFDHKSAHDATADVKATIFLSRLLSDRAPEVWSSFMRFSKKATVTDYVFSERIFCFSEFYYGKPHSYLVTSIGQNPDNSSEVYIYDLEVDPKSLSMLSDARLAARLKESPKPVRRLRCNASPILTPGDEAPEIASAKVLGMRELERRAQALESDGKLKEHLIATFESTREARLPSPHVEEQLYDAFFIDADQVLLDEFHQVPWKERMAIVEKFKDRRLRLLGQQLIHSEQPNLLNARLRRELDQNIAKRILGYGDDVRWVTLHKAQDELKTLMGNADKKEGSFLKEHHAYISERLDHANTLLQDK